MGVYHVSGLGLSPGALTMPLTAVYILQAAAQMGHNGARDFFRLSGEAGERSGSREKHPGMPEVVIVFDTPEAIDGKLRLTYDSRWFRGLSNMRQREEPIHRPIVKYLCRLWDCLEGLGVELKRPKHFYLVKVNRQDFDEVFDRATTLFYGIRRKEVWVNLIGGSNQINLALMIAGSYTMVPSRYYYVFQDAPLLEPGWLEKCPRDEHEVFKCANEILNRWNDLPPLNLGVGSILRSLLERFYTAKGSAYISKSEVLDILEKRGYTEKFIPKLIEAGYITPVDGDTFTMGPFIERSWRLFGAALEHSRIDSIGKWRELMGDSLVEVPFEC
ncbi:hypothetical protein [Thermococcus cleftensis]|uniref:hypothetical protein n=1 Tax=Thermococcus cleftensis (strain DSM 27260 / KACC 17922 / CL1) TaxID=163003 RepID=UPI00064E5612|nr:hypothetical protein [Thermococcus cleftensis]